MEKNNLAFFISVKVGRSPEEREWQLLW